MFYNLNFVIDGWNIACEIATRWMSLNLTPGGVITGPNFDRGVPLVNDNDKTHPSLRETKGPNKPHV